jgi:hypothetical protein
LLRDPVEALHAYGLQPWEEHLLNDLRAQTLDQLIAYLRRIDWLPVVLAEGERHSDP